MSFVGILSYQFWGWDFETDHQSYSSQGGGDGILPGFLLVVRFRESLHLKQVEPIGCAKFSCNDSTKRV